MANFPLFFKLFKFGIRDSIVIVASCILTVIFNLIYGILGGIVLTLLMNIPNMANKLSVEKILLNEKPVYKIHGAVYFISVNKLIKIMTKELPKIDEVVIDFAEVKNIDETSVERLSDFYRTVNSMNKKLILLNCN